MKFTIFLGAQKAGLLEEARDAWLTAVALDPGCAPALTGLGHLEGAQGNIGQVWGELTTILDSVHGQARNLVVSVVSIAGQSVSSLSRFVRYTTETWRVYCILLGHVGHATTLFARDTPLHLDYSDLPSSHKGSTKDDGGDRAQGT